jgi:exonuclease SbcD
MMKILHTSDWQVGEVLKGRDRSDEHAAVLRDIIQTIKAEDVDLVLVRCLGGVAPGTRRNRDRTHPGRRAADARREQATALGRRDRGAAWRRRREERRDLPSRNVRGASDDPQLTWRCVAMADGSVERKEETTRKAN